MAKLADALVGAEEITIDLIRHGEPAGGEMYRGTRNDPLSDIGWEQMRDAVGDYSAWQGVVSSPLLRCSEFAAEVSQKLAIPLSIQSEFREVCFGDWEGLRPAEIEAASPGALAQFWQNPLESPPPKSEPFDQFALRIADAWDDWVLNTVNKHLLLVCHGGVIRAVIAHILQIPVNNLFRTHVPYAAISRVKIYRQDNGKITPNLVFHAGSL